MATILMLAAIGASTVVMLRSVDNLKETLMSQLDDLRSAIAQVGTDLGEAVERVNSKIAELGEPDADLSAEIEALRSVSAQLDDLGAGEEPAEVVPGSVEPSVPNEDPGDVTTPVDPEAPTTEGTV